MSGPSAALLLDPKRFKKQSASSNAPLQYKLRAAGTRMLTFILDTESTTPRASTPKDDVKRDPFSSRQADVSNITRSDSKRDLGQLHGEGQSRLIEDMYGVERRENQPLKRIRVDIDKRAAGTNDKFAGISKSALGGYMKEHPEPSGSTPAPPTTNAIDLTKGKAL